MGRAPAALARAVKAATCDMWLGAAAMTLPRQELSKGRGLAICALFAPRDFAKDRVQGSQKDAVFLGRGRFGVRRINLLKIARHFGVVERV
jgi:hypothetical protein